MINRKKNQSTVRKALVVIMSCLMASLVFVQHACSQDASLTLQGVSDSELTSEIVGQTSFEGQPAGTSYQRSLWKHDGFTTGTWDDGLSGRTCVDTTFAKSGKNSLMFLYPKGEFGTGGTGAQVELFIPGRNEYYASYSVRFSDNFSWGSENEGGKLPCLAGGERCGGAGQDCTGTNGFAARIMWRKGGKGVLYLYHMDKPGKYGQDFDLKWPWGQNVFFERGKWHRIVERVKINSAGNRYDGEVEIWIDGKQVLNKRDIRFVTNGDPIDHFYMSSFHGGHDSSWAPKETCWIWFDDLRISSCRDDIDFGFSGSTRKAKRKN